MAYFTLILYGYFKTALYKSNIVFSNQLRNFSIKTKTARPLRGRAVFVFRMGHPPFTYSIKSTRVSLNNYQLS